MYQEIFNEGSCWELAIKLQKVIIPIDFVATAVLALHSEIVAL